ncbi:hypothetical protein SAMN05216326_11140 [Nitrosomonas marina]|uniref:Uncharacterized protein n=1 Tax=Nitrosomonas marina TaxID=917 RepID=A0A1I0BL57_9PROT|nr:hypothetical protein SAMN05216326_11140 [Nitrosomonas marina]
MGEKSAASSDTGTGSMFVLIAVGPARSCSGLQLSLFSNHENGNGRLTGVREHDLTMLSSTVLSEYVRTH